MMSEENKLPQEDTSPSTTNETDAFGAFEQVDVPKAATKKKRMRSNTRLLIIVTAIAAALAILLAVLLPLLSEDTGSGDNSSDTTSATQEVYPLYDHSKDNTKEKIVQAVTIKNSNDEYTLRYNKSKTLYELDGYADIIVSESAMEELIGTATTMNGYDKVKTVESLADFGLEKPSITVKISYHDNTTVTLLIGNETPDKNGYYACLQGSHEVVMINTDSVYYFQFEKAQYADPTLIASPTVKSDDDNGTVVLKELTVTGGANKGTLSLRQIVPSDGEDFSYASYLITAPYKRMVNDSVATSLSSFTYLIASKGVVLHPTAADKTKYGFDNPYAKLDITLAVQTKKETTQSDDSTTNTEYSYYNTSTANVSVGNTDENGNYYVMVDGNNAIYLTAASSLSAVIDRTYTNTISPLLFLKNIETIKQVSVSADDKIYDFKLTHDASKEDNDEKLTVICDNKQLNTADFRTLYTQLMGIHRYGETTVNPTGQPLHKIVLHENDGSLFLSMEIFGYSASLYTIRTNEGELFTVKISDISNFMTQINNYYNGTHVSTL